MSEVQNTLRGQKSIGTSVEPALYEAINALASSQDRSVASVIRAAMKAYLAQHGMTVVDETPAETEEVAQ
jgi:hypothetical protein